MARSFEITGKTLVYLFYVISVVALVPLLAVLVIPPDSLADIAIGVLFVLLLGAWTVGLWRRRTGSDGTHIGPAEDIAYDPFAYPGDGAKHAWVKAVERLPGGDSEEDDD